MARTTVVLAALLLVPLAASLAHFALSPAPEAADVGRVAAPVAPVVATAEPAAAPAPTKAAEPTAQPAPAPTPAPVGPPEALPSFASPEALLLHDGALVLAAAPSLEWGAGPTTVTPISYGFTVRRAVEAAKLPAAVRAADGARYTLYSADGRACEATAAGLSLFGEETGQHFEPGEDDDGERQPPDVAAAAQELANSAYVLEARLSAAGECAGVWARRADLPAPTVFARAADDPSLTRRVLARLGGAPAIEQLKGERRRWLREQGAEARRGAAPWERFLKDNLAVARWDEVGGDRSFVTAQIKHDEGCGGFFAETALLFELSGDRLTLRPEAGFLDPVALIDADRDGHLEAVTAGGRSLVTRGSDALRFEYSFPAVFCPC